MATLLCSRWVLIFIFTFWTVFFANAYELNGFYSLSDTDNCKKILIIDIENDFFSIYSMDHNLKNQESITMGKLNILEDGAHTYLKMNSIEALYYKNSIVIQNSGNSMNDYTYFDFCDSKYLNFHKSVE